MNHPVPCHICEGELSGGAAAGLSLPVGVSSDCRPVPGRLEFFRCLSCGTIQPAVDEAWREKAHRTYQAYETYAAAGGVEQMVAGGGDYGLSRRSDLLVAGLVRCGLLNDVKCVLDIGCGRGAFLQSFSRAFPGSALHGYEINDRNQAEIEGLAEAAYFHTGPIERLRLGADCISLIHVLEHIEKPREFLGTLRQCCREEGLLLVQVPDWEQNPFALAISDHASHFTAPSLEGLLEQSGWEVLDGARSRWVAKELTVLARARPQGPGGVVGGVPETADSLHSSLDWLRSVSGEAARICARAQGGFGIFGTAIAATWLAGQMPRAVDFFVDEDPCRVGRSHLGAPILSPSQVPFDADVYVPLAPSIAEAIRPRLESLCPAALHFPALVSAC